MELLQNFYETTLDALRDAKNERLWFKTMTKLGKLYFDRLRVTTHLSKNQLVYHPREEFNRLARILKQLRQSCQTEEGEDDLKKGTQLLEVTSPFSSDEI